MGFFLSRFELPTIAGLSREETNFMRTFLLILRVAPPAVRVQFDSEFDPGVLQKTLNQQKLKVLQPLKKQRIINQAQWDVLFPNSGKVSSDSFDLPLMICLLRNLTPMDVGDLLPANPKNISVGADLSRLKHYRNEIAHHVSGLLTDDIFENYWKDITQSIVRLGGANFQQRCDKMKVSRLDDSDKQQLTEIRTFSKEYDPVHKGLRDIFAAQYFSQQFKGNLLRIIGTLVYLGIRVFRNFMTRSIFHWKLEIYGEEIDEWEQFIVAETRAVKRVAELIRTEGIVIAIGSSGCGKSTAIHYVALQLCNQNGYEIIPVYAPEEIVLYYKPKCKQVFVIDDLCGKSSIDISLVNSWVKLSKKIEKILRHPEVKILCSCRNYIYRDRLFQSITFLSTSTCDLTSHYRLSKDERMQIANIYLNAREVKYLNDENILDRFDFFPLLCYLYTKQRSDKIQYFFTYPLKVIEDDLKLFMNTYDQKTLATLMLFVVFNNNINENLLKNTSSIELILKNISSGFHLLTHFSIYEVMAELDNLTMSFVKKVGNFYGISHDKIFDILVLFFGKNKLDLVLDIAHTCIIRDRFIFESLQRKEGDQSETSGLIQIPEELEQTYFNRLLRDIETGFITNIFSNKQLKYENFRKNFFHFPGSDKRMKGILLDLSQYEIYDLLIITIDQGYHDIVAFLLTVGNKLHCIVCQNSPVYRATVKGYLNIVKLLLDHNFNLSFIGNDGQPLQVAVERGFACITKLLLDHNAALYADHRMKNSFQIAAKKGDFDIAKLLTHYKRNPTIEVWKKTYLSTAAENGHMKIVELLILDNVDPNITWEGNPLTMAANNGFSDIVIFLLNHKADPNIHTSWGTPLFRAAIKGHIHIMKLLLVNKACPNHDACSGGGNPLYISAKKGYTNIVKLLLDNKASLDVMKSAFENPLAIATAEGHIEIVKLILEHMIKNNQSFYIGHPLYIAAKKGYINITKLLLDNKAFQTFNESSSECPLNIATAEGHMNIVQLLLEHRAYNVNCAGLGNPLCIAAEKGFINIVKMLLDKKASPNFISSFNETPLSIATAKRHIGIVKMLLEYKADPDITFQKNVTDSAPFHMHKIKQYVDYSSGTSSTSEVQNLYSNRLQISSYTYFEEVENLSPLFIAAKNGDIYIAKLLLDNKASTDFINSPNPLSIATSEGHIDIVKLFLEYRTNNYHGAGLGNPLCIAAEKGFKNIVKMLLDNKASPNFRTSFNETPLSIAKANGHYDIVKLLLEYSANPDIAFHTHVSYSAPFYM